jgi:hypothetical protein
MRSIIERFGLWGAPRFGGGGSSSQPTTSSVVQKDTLPSWAQPAYTDIFAKAKQAYENTSQTPYGGELTAAPTSAQTAGAQGLINLAGTAQGAGQPVIDLANRQLSPDFLTSSNDALTGAINAALDPITQKYQQDILPQLTSNAVTSGAYGGARDALTMQDAVERGFNREAANAIAPLAFQNYMTNEQLQQNAPGVLAQGLNLEATAPNLLLQGGGLTQGWTQDQLNQAYQQYLLNQAAPWQGLPEYAGIVMSGTPGMTRTADTTTLAGGPSRASSIFGGTLGGAATGAAIGSVVPGIGTGIGAGAGALLGALGGLF